jgi:serine/threonine-protein kinase RsbT
VAAEIRVPIEKDDDVVVARSKARELATELGFTGTDLTLLATAISEIARNITAYATRGEVCITTVQRGARSGVKVVASDNGPGIADLEMALRDGYTSGKGLGLGLPGARRLMDEFDVDTEVGRGTTVTMLKWGRDT